MRLGKKIGIGVLIVVVAYGIYALIAIQPELERVSEINQKQKEYEERINQERTSSFQLDEQFPDCYYVEAQKITVCN